MQRPSFQPDGDLVCVQQVQTAVAETLGVSLAELCRATRGNRGAAFARQAAMYLCHLVFAMRAADIARAFGRDRSTVRHAFMSIEEAREDYETDRLLGWLEGALGHAGDDAGEPS